MIILEFVTNNEVKNIKKFLNKTLSQDTTLKETNGERMNNQGKSTIEKTRDFKMPLFATKRQFAKGI